MANRSVLAFDAVYGYAENIASGDNIDMSTGGKIVNLGPGTTAGDSLAYGQSGATLAGLALTAALAMGGFQINNLGAPTLTTDAATKGYVDGLVQGVSWKSPALAVATTNVATLSGTATVDGVALVAGNRVLLTAQTTASQNGLWVVASGAWTRPSDFATGADAASDAVWVEKGTANADTAWVCTSDTGSAVIDTSSLVFVKFTSATAYAAGAGLTLTGTTFAVKAGDGVETVSNTASTNVRLDATAPGIQFTGAAGSGALQVKALSTGGIQVLGTGVSILLPASSGLQTAAGGLSVLNDPNGGLTASVTGEAIKPDTASAGNPTVAVGANGLRVLGVPALFTLAGTAVSAAVTAANLGILTAGPTSNADALHAHLAQQGAFVSVSALNAGDPVYWSSTANQVDKALGNTDTKSFVVGVNSGAAVAAAGTAQIIFDGPATGILTAATPGAVYYLQPTGGLSTALPGGGGNRLIIVGTAKNATDLWVRIRDIGKKF